MCVENMLGIITFIRPSLICLSEVRKLQLVDIHYHRFPNSIKSLEGVVKVIGVERRGCKGNGQ